MAVEDELIKRTATMLLNNGVSPTGTVKTVSVSIGTLNPSAWNLQKASNIVNAMSGCLTKAMTAARHVDTYEMYED